MPEAVLQRTRTTKHPWLITCDADMSPEDFEKSLWFQRVRILAPAGVSTCRSKNVKGEWVEKVHDYVIACSSLKGRISDTKIDFESRPHTAVTFVGATIAEGVTWIQRRKITRKKHGRERWEEGEEDEGSGQRQVRKMTKSEKELEALRGWPLKNVVLTQEKKG